MLTPSVRRTTLCLSVTVSIVAAARGQPKSEAVLGDYQRQFLDRFHRCSFEYEAEQRLYGPTAPTQGFVFARVNGQVVRGRRDHIREEVTTRYFAPAPDPSGIDRMELLHDGGRVTLCPWLGPKPPPMAGLIHSEGVTPGSADELRCYLPNPAAAVVYGLLGTPPGPVTVGDALRTGEVEANGTTVLLRARGDHGQAELQVDSGLGYRPIRYARILSADDRVAGVKVKDLPVIPGWINIQTPQEGRSRTVDVTYSGQTLPCDITLVDTEVQQHHSGQERKIVSTVRIRKLTFNPDLSSAYRLATPVKDGTPVNVETDPMFQYVWSRGRVVKTGSEVDHAPAPAPEPPEGRPAWHWALLVCILSAVGAMLVRATRR